MEIDVVILCGGNNSRMKNFPKGKLEFYNSTFLEKIISEVKKLSVNITLSLKEGMDEDICIPSCNKIFDEIKNIGPISGIYEGLKKGVNQWVAFTPWDMPFICSEMYITLLKELERNKFGWNELNAVIPKVGNQIFPLNGLYSKSSLNYFKEQIDRKNFKIKNVLDNINTLYVDFEETSINKTMFLNINTYEEYKLIFGESSAIEKHGNNNNK